MGLVCVCVGGSAQGEQHGLEYMAFSGHREKVGSVAWGGGK